MRKVLTLSERFTTRQRGFTLIELLVVVSIIALLIAILLPVLSNVKYSVRTTQCASRLKQMGIAVTAYAVDNDQSYPHKMADNATVFEYEGKMYREDRKPWVIRSTFPAGRFDYVPLIEPYVSDLSDIFICPHLDTDWEDAYRQATNATEIPYAMYWGIVKRGPGGGGSVARPAVELGEGFGPGGNLDGGGITADSRYRILASDKARTFVTSGERKHFANHPPTGGDYQLATNQSNGRGRGYEFAEDTNGNANYLYDDGSVILYGQINKDTIGNTADDDFRNAGNFWLAPTDRVE